MSESAVTCARQQFIDSAKPCSSSTSGAPSSPATSASKVRVGEIVIWVRAAIAANLAADALSVHHGVVIAVLRFAAPGLASHVDAKGMLLQDQWKAFPFISIQECFDASAELAPASRTGGLPGWAVRKTPAMAHANTAIPVSF